MNKVEYWMIENAGFTEGTSWFPCGEHSYNNKQEALDDLPRQKRQYGQNTKYRITHLILQQEHFLV